MRTNKDMLDCNKREREILNFDFNSYKTKITDEIAGAKEEAWVGWCEQKKLIDRIGYSVNKQTCINQRLEADMKGF